MRAEEVGARERRVDGAWVVLTAGAIERGEQRAHRRLA
jgi:hypothetical protein